MSHELELSEHSISQVFKNNSNTSTSNKQWDLEKFKQNINIAITHLDDELLEFDIVGINAGIANAFRRILLADIPSMAIDKIMIHNNTSIIDDEQLAHRLGLIPIKVDSELFEFKSTEENAEPCAEDTIEFNLQVKCTKNPNASKDTTDKNELYLNHRVTSKCLNWNPIGNQAETLYQYKDGIKAVNDDILIALLKPGQELDVTMHCVKSFGHDHAKFSPVCTASYRFLSKIELLESITGEDALLLQSCFAPGVIDIDIKNGDKQARVAKPHKDTCNREIFRHTELSKKVRLGKVTDHFIFQVESTGVKPPDVLILESVKILEKKCHNLLSVLEELKRSQAKEKDS